MPQVVLVNPQIPQNTGSIARTCAATKSPLFIVGKPAFEISDKTVRRAGLDYWPYVNLKQYPSWSEYLAEEAPENIWLLSKFAKKSYHTAEYGQNDALVFGSETKGLGKEFLDEYPLEQQLLIPMAEKNVRSLNLSNAVSIVLYESLKQLGELS